MSWEITLSKSGKFRIWSNIVDNFITPEMSIKKLLIWFRKRKLKSLKRETAELKKECILMRKNK